MSYNNIKDLFFGICNAIREKDGSTSKIKHQDIPERIMNIPVNKVSQSGLSFTSCKKINDDWEFKLITSSPTSNEHNSTAAQTVLSEEFAKVNLPHDWSIYNSFNSSSKATYEGGYLDGGDAWYRKKLTIEDTDNRYFLYFEGIYMESDVIVNGNHLATHKHGYTNFIVEITDVVNVGSENEILVYVKNKQPSSRWYSGSGIYRDVFLLKSGKVGFKQQSVIVTTPDLETEYSKGYCTTNAVYSIENTTSVLQSVSVVATLKYFGFELASKTFNLSVGADSSITKTFDMIVSDPKLWDEYDGQYYTLTLNMYNSEGKIISNSEVYYGYRYFKFDPNTGFWLNGRNLKLRGACMHHDLGCLGAEVNQSAIDRQIKKLKDAGFNAIRLTHNPSCAEFTNACMRMGMMCIEEAFDCWTIQKKPYDYARFFLEYAESDVKSMVKRSINNPCVIAWSLGNEIYDTRSSNSAKVLQDPIVTVQNLRNWVREIDTTRPCTLGENGMYDSTAKLVSNELDIQGLNYATYSSYHKSYPNWCLYGSETTSAISSRCVYARDDVNHQCSSYDDDKVSWGSYAYKQIDLTMNTDYCAGMFIWTGWDYIGEPTPFNKYPCRSSYFGTIDIAGLPKDSYYLYQSMWTDKPMCHIVPMDWSKWTVGENVRVMVYSNAASIKLYLNGNLLGTYTNKNIADSISRGSFYADVPFEKGRLVANAYDANNNLIAQDVVYTEDIASKLTLLSEKSYYKDEEDLLFVEVDVCDRHGHLCTSSNNTVSIEVNNGLVIGVDNGDATSVLPYRSASKPVFHGKAVCVVRPNKNSTSVTITAHSDGLTSSSITVNRGDMTVYAKQITSFIDATEPYTFEATEYHCESIQLDTNTLNLTPSNSSHQLVATITPENCTDAVTYLSDNSSVALVNNTGLVSLVNDGSCTITVTCGAKSATCSVTVEGVSVDCETLTLSETSITLNDRSQHDITATVTPDNCTYEVSWVSEDEDIVIIDNGGHMTGVNNGTTNIVATCGSKTARCAVTVSIEEVVIPCESISLDQTNLTFASTTPQQLAASVAPENTTDIVRWSSDDESIAVVKDGLITPKSNGQCIITATCGNFSSSCSVTIEGLNIIDWDVEWNGEATLPEGLSFNTEYSTMVLNEDTGLYEVTTSTDNQEGGLKLNNMFGHGVVEVELISDDWTKGSGWKNGIDVRVKEKERIGVHNNTGKKYWLTMGTKQIPNTELINGQSSIVRIDNTHRLIDGVSNTGSKIWVNGVFVLDDTIKHTDSEESKTYSNVWVTSSVSRIRAIRYKCIS